MGLRIHGVMRQLRYAFTDMTQHSAANLIHRSRNGKTKCMTVSRSVAFDHDAAQSQQTCTIVAAVVDPAFEGLYNRNRDETGEFGQKIAPEFLAQKSGEHLRNPFR